jgi:parvulin-like peptidyl-prolyl isomerase
MKKYLIHILVFIVCGLLFVFKCAKKSETIATVGKLTVSRNEVLKLMANKYPNQPDFKNVELTKKKEILDDLIFKKLKINEALEMGLDKENSFIKTDKEKFEHLMLFRYYEKFVVDQLISEDEMDEMKEKRNIELRASHILIGFNEANKRYDRPKEEAKNLAQFVSNEARSGEDYNDLVKKYSDDPNTNDKNGDLDYFRWGKMAGPFQEKAWTMKVGEISEPVETQFGFHIIRLDDRREIPSFGSDRDIYYQIKQELFTQRRAKAGKIADSLYAGIRDKYSFQLNTEGIKNLTEIIKNKKAEHNEITDKSFSDEEKMMVLAEWDNVKLSLDSLIKRLGYQVKMVLPDFKNESILQDYILRYANNELMVKDALDAGLDKDEYVVEELEKYRQNRLAQLYEDKQLKQKMASIENSEIEQYYQNNPEEFKSQDGKILPMEKIKGKIRTKIWKAKSDAKIAEHKKILYEKYPVTINEKALAEI